jgi:hypothetical protein
VGRRERERGRSNGLEIGKGSDRALMGGLYPKGSERDQCTVHFRLGGNGASGHAEDQPRKKRRYWKQVCEG